MYVAIVQMDCSRSTTYRGLPVWAAFISGRPGKMPRPGIRQNGTLGGDRASGDALTGVPIEAL